MKILALDTATPSCSVAVADAGILLAEITVTAGRSHSRHVMALIHRAMEWAGLSLGALDGFAVSMGPGTFTGLRIGISTIRGLAAASGKPVAGISSLKALALQAAPVSGLICPLLDARKGEVYLGCYRFKGGCLTRQGEERVLPPEGIAGVIDAPCTFIGPGASLYQDVIIETLGGYAAFAPACQNTIRASSLAWLAENRMEETDGAEVEPFAPVYIRKSDAELRLSGSGV